MLIALLLIVSFGCVVSDPVLKASLAEIGDQPGEWTGDSAAAITAWQRAEVWVTRHSATRVKVVSGNVIQNEKREDSEGSRYEIAATKEPFAGGMYRIALEVGGSCIACTPKPEELQLLFADYLRTGTDRMQGIGVLIGIK